MSYAIAGQPINKSYLTAFPADSTVTGFVDGTDVGKFVVASSNKYALMVGTTADDKVISGIVAAVPTATTPGSTVPFYVQKISYGELIEASYSSDSTVITTTNIGKFFGVNGTTTVAGAVNLNPAIAGNAAGTTDGLFFKMLKFSTQNNVMWGTINSSHLSV